MYHISTILNVRYFWVEAKWKNVKDQFGQKFDKSGSGGISVDGRVQNWKFYDRMSFLKPFVGNARK